MSTDIELTPEAFKWLYSFVQDAIDGGLSDVRFRSFVEDDVYKELDRHDLIERAPGGRGGLTDSFVKEILQGINLYGIIRGIVYERSQDDC